MEEEDVWNSLIGKDDEEECDDFAEHSVDLEKQPEDEDPESRLRGVQYESCIQSNDITDKVISIAPGEGHYPVPFTIDPSCEERAFPQLFVTGKFGFQTEREVKLTEKKYFTARILNKDPRFAKNIEYLFFAQFVCEQKQVMDCISIALRKGRIQGQGGEKVTAGMLQDPGHLRSLIHSDQAYKFLQPVRGSPPYWQRVMYKVLAAVKQFGIFTWFLTLSAADLTWTDTLQAISKQLQYNYTEQQIKMMSWEEKTSLLSENPVTAARHFDHRLQCFFRDILLSKQQPLGKIVHYFYRIEFQQRGSPHAHAVIWTNGAPNINTDTQDTISAFINKYVTCHIPSESSEPHLRELVHSRQRHSHSASCKTSGKGCRFNYPRPPSPQTLIAIPEKCSDDVDINNRFNNAQKQLSTVSKFITNHTEDTLTLEELLLKAGVSLEQYMEALKITKNGPSILLEREPNEAFINNYNPILLKAWEANMDLQFVCNPYACIHYIVSYVTKNEHEMGQVLKAASKEMFNASIKQQMSKCASAFLNCRELGAQEAVYRLLGLPLYRSNFETVFIPSDIPSRRISLIKSRSSLEELEDESEDVFATSLADRYSARPSSLGNMCLAEFAQMYSTCSKTFTDNQSTEFQPDLLTETLLHPKYIVLHNNLGRMRLRKKPAVVRYHTFLELKDPEGFSHSNLMLFYPWKDESEILGTYPSYSAHYQDIKSKIMYIKGKLQRHEDTITSALTRLEEDGPPTHAWEQIATQTVQDGLDMQQEDVLLHPDHQLLAPPEDQRSSDVLQSAALPPVLAVEKRPDIMPDVEYRNLVRSLNSKQHQIYNTVLHWCRCRVKSCKTGEVMEPFHVFVSGGAGTGKSHLISAVYQMVQRTLRCEGECPDEVKIVLTAPTGTAAFNISGVTLHAALLLPLGQSQSYMKLSDDKRNTLRTKLQNLQILIIDEISMVGTDLFLEIHRRLCEIKGSVLPFGGVSIMAFGDFYQLPPVAQRFIFEPPKDKFAHLVTPLWQQFTMIELTQIMRQKEIDFADLLNRVRTRTQTHEDIDILLSRNIKENETSTYPHSALHVFAVNKKVDHHNNKMLDSLNIKPRTILSENKIPKELKNIKLPSDQRYTGNLPDQLRLAENARIMLTHNISDGLANGCLGTIVGFVDNPSISFPLAILIQFDSPLVGKNTRPNSPYKSHTVPTAVPVLPVEIPFTVSRSKKGLTIIRKQFPLKLAWATTIHKVQGLTLKEIVISFEDPFFPGQAYVALSRVQSLTGLFLKKFHQDKIKVSSKVATAMKELKSKCKEIDKSPKLTQNTIKIGLLNIRSLPRHFQDFENDSVFNSCQVIGITESMLHSKHRNVDFHLSGYKLLRQKKKHNRWLENVQLYIYRKIFNVLNSFLTTQQ